MRFPTIVSVLSVGVAMIGCRSDTASSSSQGTSAADAKEAFESPAKLTQVLECRWPVSAITEFCIPERRLNVDFQNLVTYTDVVWQEDLHAKTQSGFDEIWWHANTEGGRATKYSLNAKRGDDYWLLEIGNEQTVQDEPDITPDPSQPRFVGRR